MRITYLVMMALAVFSTTANGGVLAPFQTFTNTDWTISGVSGLRGQGFGNISVSGVSGSVSSAYLYWHGPTNSSDPTVNANVTFNGSSITGTNIGTSQDNFWGFANSQAYRADVSSLVSGNGSYSLSDFIKPNAEINGASLMVFYDDGVVGNNRDVVVFDGNDANFASAFDPAGWQATLNGINYSGGPANLVFGVSDGQSFPDPNALLNGSVLIPPGADPWSGTSVPNAGGGVGNGGLWDIRSYDVTSFLSPGINNLSLQTTTNPGDALSLIHLAFDLPVGAAPPPPGVVPEPGSMALWSALLGVGLIRRRRKDS